MLRTKAAIRIENNSHITVPDLERLVNSSTHQRRITKFHMRCPRLSRRKSKTCNDKQSGKTLHEIHPVHRFFFKRPVCYGCMIVRKQPSSA